MSGKGIFCFDFIAEDMNDVVPTDLSGNLEIELCFTDVMTEPIVVFLIGDTTGLIARGQYHTVTCDIRG